MFFEDEAVETAGSDSVETEVLEKVEETTEAPAVEEATVEAAE